MVRKLAAYASFSLMFLLLLVPSGVCSGDDVPQDWVTAVSHVFVEVDANIGVLALEPYLDLGSIQTGVFEGTIPFRVDANTQKVRLWGAASLLYKGDDPDGAEIPPITLAYASGIRFVPQMGGPVGGQDNQADYTGVILIDGFRAGLTEKLVFESSQNNHFSQQVDMVVQWDQPDPEKPMGEYSGKVKLFASVVLPGEE